MLNSQTGNNYVIYGLRLDSDPTIRYVGYTTVGTKLRLRRHKSDSKNLSDNRRIYNWMRKHGEDSVIIETIEVCPDGDLDTLQSREVYWIAFYRNKTDSLLNHNDGGKGGNSGYKHTKEAIDKIIENSTTRYKELGDAHPFAKQKGELHPMFGRKQSDETIQKIKKSLTGKKLSEETRNKMKVSRPSTAGNLHWSKTPEGKKIKARGDHKTHHVNRNIIKEDCEFCTQD